jgi:hypothetical protein
MSARPEKAQLARRFSLPDWPEVLGRAALSLAHRESYAVTLGWYGGWTARSSTESLRFVLRHFGFAGNTRSRLDEGVRGRLLLWFSIGLNAALVLMLWRLLQVSAPQDLAGSPMLARGPTNTVVRTNVVVRRQLFLWSEIESHDYPIYIANLRRIGCPEATIRDIIVADVNQLYARRRATEVVTAPQQWWRSEPDRAVRQTALAQIRALEEERRALLTKLLGPDWESADYPLPSLESITVLDGPVLGSLPPETKLALQRIEQQSLERMNAYVRERRAEDEPPDPAELARLRRQTRDELARVLTPEQLEEYLLRYSQNAVQLRVQLRGFDASAEEFRSLFRTLDPLNQELQLNAGSADPATTARRQELERQRETALRELLGTERYEDYQLSQNPLYRQARELATQSGVSQDQVAPLMLILGVTEKEEQRIRNDASLTAEELAEQLQTARDARQASLRRLLGEEAFRRYEQRQAPVVPSLPPPSPQP